MKRLHLAFLAVLAAVGIVTAAYAGGTFEQYPSATAPLTGSETIPADTNLSSGRNPQTEKITTAILRDGVLANAGTVLGSAPTTATATAGAATASAGRVTVTSEALTTAAGADYTLTLTNTHVLATSIVLCSPANGTNTTEGLSVQRTQPSAGSVVIKVRNTHAASALNGTIKVNCAIIN